MGNDDAKAAAERRKQLRRAGRMHGRSGVNKLRTSRKRAGKQQHHPGENPGGGGGRT